uniref:Bromodomain-containing protein DDB_G0270170-like isoform X2 n=1 Tax=Dermatophagoides pteronyssinus TaxID=6956 RepID=A0A6P6YL35_DERPT|nr:bromodomain-containing protein DDB_G0270170-like isoform X2 [Dermatophagoides pteronyssinus]
MTKILCFWETFWNFSKSKNVNAIRSLRIMAPDYIFYRDPMWLNCSMIDLDYNQIYSIKWFKDNQEMYRFITADELTPRTFYDTTGIVIDESRSNYGNLYILQTDFKTEADFRCEVLAENDFTTAIQIKKIHIPRDGQPIIVGKKSHFSPNEPVNLTCTSPMSTPPARLVINLNGNSLVSSNQNNIDDNQNNDVMKTNQIIMRTYYRHFENGQSSTSVNVQFPGSWLQAKRINQFECTSSIIHRFNRTANVRLEMKIDSSNNNNHTLYVPILDHHTNNDLQDRLSPKIENLKKKYELGEQISLRCLSSKYKPMPELYWLVNGQQLDAQFLDYNKQNDFNQNGFIRLDLKYPLNGKNQNNDNDDQNDNGQQQLQQQHYSYHQHQRRQHGNNLSTKRNSPNWNRRIQLSNSNNDDSFDSKYQSSSSILIDSYHFECIQVLSNVISVSSEVVQLYGTSSSSSSSSSSGSNNHDLEQSLHHGNAVEAVKSFIGNSAGSSSSLLFVKQINSFVLMMIIVSIYATMF